MWGGDAKCEHEWSNEIIANANDSNRRSMEWATGGNPASKVLGERPSQGRFCQHCGAWRGVLGLEPTPEAFVEHIVEVFRGVWRVLRDDGTLWLNLGSSYNSQGGHSVPEQDGRSNHAVRQMMKGANAPGFKPKDLVPIPWMVALALQQDGWYLRSDIIWSKPNPMPESVRGSHWSRHRVKGQDNQTVIDCPGCFKCTPNDGYIRYQSAGRPTKSHEYLFLLAKQPTYYYDAEAIREPAIHEGRVVKATGDQSKNGQSADGVNNRNTAVGFTKHDTIVSGRNKRTVWTVATQAYLGAHFAAFPEALVRPCIQAGTSEWGCCAKCGAPYERIVEVRDPNGRLGKGYHDHANDLVRGQRGVFPADGAPTKVTQGWRKTCQHRAEVVPATVLDPFLGSGTTALVAQKLGRRCVGIDASAEYLEMAVDRTNEKGMERML